MILAIIQARMSSTRLPGKTMKLILGKPMIFYLLQQLRGVGLIDDYIVAITDERADDVLFSYLKSTGTPVYRGSTHDVLDRFYKAAKQYNPEHVMRITADCPLIDPQIYQKLIKSYLKGRFAYASLSQQYAEGLDGEIFTGALLKKIKQNARQKSELEHMTLYVHNHKSEFRILSLPNDRDDSRYRITVDEAVDFQVVSAIIYHLSKRYQPPYHFYQIRKYLDAHPEVMRLNNTIYRNEGLLKSLENDDVVLEKI